MKRNYRSILSQLYYNTDFLRKKYKLFGNFYKLYKVNQYGGGFNIVYKNTYITFDKIIDEGRLSLFLSVVDDKNNLDNKDTLDNKDNCIFIIIYDDMAYIEGITSNKYTKCFDTPEFNNGKSIMEITIKILNKYKDKLKINQIQLKDNSFILCDNTKICLADLSFLQYNDTFYGKFGFRPFEESIYEKYFTNRVILTMTLVGNIDLPKIMKEYNNSIDIRIKDKIIHNYTKYKDTNIVQWFSKFSRKYFNADCKLMKYLIEAIYKELKLTSMKGETFILKI